MTTYQHASIISQIAQKKIPKTQSAGKTNLKNWVAKFQSHLKRPAQFTNWAI